VRGLNRVQDPVVTDASRPESAQSADKLLAG
jgi:hypothetical protein